MAEHHHDAPANPYFENKRSKEEEQVLEQRVANLEKVLIEKGIDADGLLIQGATREMILQESEKLNIDLIIIGHHEHGLLYKIFAGSVASQVIKHSKIPVLTVPIE